MSRATEIFVPRSEAAWSRLCAHALPEEAGLILCEAHEAGGFIDEADAWLAWDANKSESQARSKARREEVLGWGTRADGDDDQDQEPADQAGEHPGLGAWAGWVDPSESRAGLEIRAAFEACNASAALEAAGLADLAGDVEIVGRVDLEMRQWRARCGRDEVDTAALARRDGVTRRTVQLALLEKMQAVGAGQRDLFEQDEEEGGAK